MLATTSLHLLHPDALDRESTVLPDHSPEELVLAWGGLARRWPGEPSTCPLAMPPAALLQLNPCLLYLCSTLPSPGQARGLFLEP